MTKILKAVSLSTSRRQRQHGVFTIQRQDRRLLIDTQYRRMLRRVQIQADDLRRVGLEVRVIGRDVAFQPMRLQAAFRPDAGDRHVRDAAVQFGRRLS